MAPLHVATLTELPKYEITFSIYLCTNNETMAPFHVVTLRELPKYEIIFRI